MRSLKQLVFAAFSVVLLWPSIARAQENAPQTPLTYYKLIYRLLQVGDDGKVENSRTYSAIIGASPDEITMIRTGDQVPIPSGTGNTEYNYHNVGTSIDTSRPSAHDRQLQLRVSVETSSVVKSARPPAPIAPIIRQAIWKSNVTVILDKPT